MNLNLLTRFHVKQLLATGQFKFIVLSPPFMTTDKANVLVAMIADDEPLTCEFTAFEKTYREAGHIFKAKSEPKLLLKGQPNFYFDFCTHFGLYKTFKCTENQHVDHNLVTVKNDSTVCCSHAMLYDLNCDSERSCVGMRSEPVFSIEFELLY